MCIFKWPFYTGFTIHKCGILIVLPSDEGPGEPKPSLLAFRTEHRCIYKIRPNFRLLTPLGMSARALKCRLLRVCDRYRALNNMYFKCRRILSFSYPNKSKINFIGKLGRFFVLLSVKASFAPYTNTFTACQK